MDQDVVVFKGSTKDIAKFKKLVGEVDVAVSELLVKAVVLEVQTTRTTGSAVDLVASILKGSQFSMTTNGVNDSPTLIKREIRTDIVAGDGDLVLLGGLDEERESGGSTGLSFLPAFFRSSSDESSKTEIVLMIQAERI